MKFLLCSTDDQTFDMVIGTSPVVGSADRFVVPMDVYFDDLSADFDLYKEELEELGITLLSIV